MKSTNHERPNRHLQSLLAIREVTSRRAGELVAELTTIARIVDAADLFSVLAPLMTFGPRDGVHEAEYGTVPVQIEHLAFYLWPYAYDGDQRPFPTAEQIQRCLDIMPELVLNQSVAAAEDGIEVVDEETAFLLHSLRMHSRIVRGSAYPEQTAEEIIGIQGQFDKWFERRTGISPTRAASLLVVILAVEEEHGTKVLQDCRNRQAEARAEWDTANAKPEGKLTETEQLTLRHFPNKEDAATAYGVFGLEKSLCATVPVSYETARQSFPELTETEWMGLQKLIGLTSDNRSQMTDPFEVRATPLYVLPDGRVFLADISNAMDALWGKYEITAHGDSDFFDRLYVPRRTTWVESKVVECMTRIFPSEMVHMNVRYPDPTRPGGEAEADILVTWGPFLAVIEVKAKAISPATLNGDPIAVRRDVKKTIVDPMVQAARILKYISSTDKPLFMEGKTGKTFTVAPTIPPKTFSIAVSQHHLSGLSTDLKQLESLNPGRKTCIYPLSICLADLDVITTFCQTPEVFLHFLQRRLELQAAENLLHGDEQDIFLAYLENRLNRDRFRQSDDKGKPNAVSFMGWGDEIRQYFQWRRGERTEKPTIRLRIPDEITDTLAQLRERKDDAAYWIAFGLLDFPNENLNNIADFIHHLASTALQPETFRTFTSESEDTAIYVTGACPSNISNLEFRTNVRTNLEKYRRRKTKAIGLSFVTNGHQAILYTASWIEGEWHPDEALDKLSEEIRGVPISASDAIVRNKGSGINPIIANSAHEGTAAP